MLVVRFVLMNDPASLAKAIDPADPMSLHTTKDPAGILRSRDGGET